MACSALMINFVLGSGLSLVEKSSHLAPALTHGCTYRAIRCSTLAQCAAELKDTDTPCAYTWASKPTGVCVCVCVCVVFIMILLLVKSQLAPPALMVIKSNNNN